MWWSNQQLFQGNIAPDFKCDKVSGKWITWEFCVIWSLAPFKHFFSPSWWTCLCVVVGYCQYCSLQTLVQTFQIGKQAYKFSRNCLGWSIIANSYQYFFLCLMLPISNSINLKMRTLKIHTLIKYNSDKKAACKISTSPLN